MVVNGDVLTDCDVGALVEFHRDRGAEATIYLTPVDDPSVFGVVPTDEDGRVEAFIEKPPRDEAPTNLINAGIYVVEPSVLDRIPRRVAVSIERETFPAMVADRTLFALALDAYWLDTGTPDAYLRAHRDLLAGRRPGPPAPGAELDPSIGPGVWRIGASACTEGAVERSLLGAGASVGSERDGRGLGDRRGRGGRGRGLGRRLGAPPRRPGRVEGDGRGIDHRTRGDRRAALRDPRPCRSSAPAR